MKFTPHERVLDLFVGQNLYTSSDAAMRELLQNAEDACSLQKLKDASYQPTIVVRYSTANQCVEVVDNGLGMNHEAVEHSFASAGAPKEDIGHIRELLQSSGNRQHQIAQFGIG